MLDSFSFRRLAGGLGALMLAMTFGVTAPLQAGLDEPSAPAWTNVVAGQAWGTNAPATPAADTNAVATVASDPVREELRRLLADDDAAQAEADRLMQEYKQQVAAGGVVTEEGLQLRLRSRFIAVRGAYEQFLTRHPTNVDALLAFGSLLDDLGDDVAAAEQWEKARVVAPRNPATWNNLANYYAANGNELKAFSYYEKAISLATNSAAYQRNLGSAIINLRTNAMAYYSLGEPAVLTKALGLLRAAEKSLPDDFALATEIAQMLYAVRPARPEELQAAWRRALELAGDDVEREGVRLHLARVELLAGRTAEARAFLNTVTNAAFAPLRRELEAQLAKALPAAGTNASVPPR